MKSADMVNLPENLNYTDEHVWVRQDGDTLVAGISDSLSYSDFGLRDVRGQRFDA